MDVGCCDNWFYHIGDMTGYLVGMRLCDVANKRVGCLTGYGESAYE